MRWKIILGLASVFVFVTAGVAADGPGGFREIAWGTSYDQVVEQLRQSLGPEAESGRNAFDEYDFMVWEDVSVFEIPSVMFAECSQPYGLIRGWYFFRYGVQQDESDWIYDFDYLTEELSRVHGEPRSSGPIWFGGDEEQYQDDLPGALRDAKAAFGSTWCFSTTSIELSLEKMGMFRDYWLTLKYKHSSASHVCDF